MRTGQTYLVVALLMLAGAAAAYDSIQSAHGPIPSVTGAPAFAGKPAEWNCTLCHFSETDNLNTPGGAVEILGVPSEYAAGQTYPLRVRLRTDSTLYSPLRKWGFQITALSASLGESVGAWIYDADTLQVETGWAGDFENRTYLEHTDTANRTGLAGPVEWRFSWTAPPSPAGKVYFFAAGNAAEGTEDPGLDFIFTTADSADPAGATAVGDRMSARAFLAAPRPNPSSGPVTFEYALASPGHAELAIFDLQGRRRRTLIAGSRAGGAGLARWDGCDDAGVPLAAGVYLARLTAPGEVASVLRKVVVAR